MLVCVCFSTCLSVWGCVCVHAYVCGFCYWKGNGRAGYYFPSTTSRPHIFECINSMAIANASPMSITFLWIAKMERDRETERLRGGVGAVEIGWGEGARCPFFTLCACLKKNLKCRSVHWKASARWMLKYLWHQCFFSPVCIQAASSHAAVSMAISICVRN